MPAAGSRLDHCSNVKGATSTRHSSCHQNSPCINMHNSCRLVSHPVYRCRSGLASVVAWLWQAFTGQGAIVLSVYPCTDNYVGWKSQTRGIIFPGCLNSLTRTPLLTHCYICFAVKSGWFTVVCAHHAGLLDTCNVFLNNLQPHQPQLLMFEVGAQHAG
jgi:hypothetical protein